LVVLRPLKVVIENYPENTSEEFDAPYHPNDPTVGSRKLPFAREIYIERDDFMENPPKDFFRLGIGREVRLRYAYFIKCHQVIKNAAGEIVELRCTYDPLTRGGNAPDGRKVKGTIHWVAVNTAIAAEIRLYDRLFSVANPDGEEGKDFKEFLNPNSLEIISDAKLEPSLADAASNERYQFERQGYFSLDQDSGAQKLVFNRIVSLKDTWKKMK